MALVYFAQNTLVSVQGVLSRYNGRVATDTFAASSICMVWYLRSMQASLFIIIECLFMFYHGLTCDCHARNVFYGLAIASRRQNIHAKYKCVKIKISIAYNLVITGQFLNNVLAIWHPLQYNGGETMPRCIRECRGGRCSYFGKGNAWLECICNIRVGVNECIYAVCFENMTCWILLWGICTTWFCVDLNCFKYRRLWHYTRFDMLIWCWNMKVQLCSTGAKLLLL